MTIGFIIYFILFIIGLVSYANKKPANVLVCLFAIGTGCFKFLPTEGSLVHPYDLMIFLTLIITVSEVTKVKGYFNCKEDPIGRIILIVLIYTSLVCAGSIAAGQELLSFALKVYRVNLMFLIYFYLRRQQWGVVKRFFNTMLVFSIIQGVFCYLQLVGIEVLQVGSSESDGVTRYAGFPSLSVFYILLAMVDDKMKMANRLFLFAFFGGTILISMNRGPILTVVIAYGTYIMLHRRAKNLLYLAVFAVVYFVAIAPVLERRNNERSSGSEELRAIIENPLNAHESFTAGSGSVLYRIACVTERFDYLLQNPQYLPFGIGTVHENSPMNHYNVFITGLHNEVLIHQKETVSSDDITWVNVLMRYGIVGVILFLMMYIIGARVGFKQLKMSSDPYFVIGAAMPLAYLFASMGTNHFDYAIRIVEFLLPLIIIRMYANKPQSKLEK